VGAAAALRCLVTPGDRLQRLEGREELARAVKLCVHPRAAGDEGDPVGIITIEDVVEEVSQRRGNSVGMGHVLVTATCGPPAAAHQWAPAALQLLQQEIVDETDIYMDNEQQNYVNARTLSSALPPHLRRAVSGGR